jgi:hypothetical protein
VFIPGVALGVLFGWLIRHNPHIFARVVDVLYRKEDGILKDWAWFLFVCVFIGGAYILAFADYDVDNSYLPDRVVSAFHFLMAPRLLKSLLGFLLGWYCFARRRTLLDSAGHLWARVTLSPDASSLPKADQPIETDPPRMDAGLGSAQSRRNRPSIWLTNSVAIAAVSAVVIVVLAVMEPDAFSRLTSFKFGNVVEAKFATAVEHSVRASAPTFGGSLTARQLLERGTELPGVIRDVFRPASKILAAEHNNSDNNVLNEQQEDAFLFLQGFAFPLAQAVTCYLNEFPVGDTAVQHEAVIIADRWRRMETGDDNPKTNYDELAKASTGLIDKIQHALPKGLQTNNDDYAYYVKVNNCDLRTLKRTLPQNWSEKINNNISDVLKSGMVISFISNLVAFTQDFPTAATFLEEMDKLGGKAASLADGDPLGRFVFYYTRVSAKYFAGWYPQESIKSDFDAAQAEIDGILAGMPLKSSDQYKGVDIDSLKQYFEEERARLINNRIYYLLNESLQGRPLSRAEADEVRLLTAQLKGWISRQNSKPYHEDPHSIAELIDNKVAKVIPPFYDTLATEQIAEVQSKGQPTDQECTQIRIYLDTARNLYSELARQSHDDGRDDLKIIAARRSLYASICASRRS